MRRHKMLHLLRPQNCTAMLLNELRTGCNIILLSHLAITSGLSSSVNGHSSKIGSVGGRKLLCKAICYEKSLLHLSNSALVLTQRNSVRRGLCMEFWKTKAVPVDYFNMNSIHNFVTSVKSFIPLRKKRLSSIISRCQQFYIIKVRNVMIVTENYDVCFVLPV